MKTPKYLIVLFTVATCIACKKKDALEGFDKSALFAPPLNAEIKAVEQIWAQRDLLPRELLIEATHTITPALSLHIISFKLTGSKEYAALLVPNTPHPVPVQFQVGGFGLNEEPVNSAQVELQGDDLPFIFVLPALRGQYVSIRIKSIEYKSPLSEGSRLDAFDGATDDVIASLNAVGTLFANADPSRATIRGGSRGGIVALLAGERDPRFKRVAPVAFSVDFIGLTAQSYNDPTYKAQFLQGLLDGTATIAETRRLIIASSPLYFCSRLPKTQLHCAANDKITPAAQGELLFNEMKKQGLQDSVQLFIYPNRDHNNIALGNTELETRINSFFAELR